MVGGYNRYVSRKKALRKRRIDREVDNSPIYNNLHQYSKNKIHCSCPYCSAKTKRRKKDADWGPGRYNYTMPDRRRQEAMDYDERINAQNLED